jgi:uncharacterized integral membrane protein
MKTIATVVTSLIVAVWVVAIAIIAVQNADPVSFRFLTVQTFELPFGVVLAFGVALGIIGMAIAQPLLGFSIGRSGDDDAS